MNAMNASFDAPAMTRDAIEQVKARRNDDNSLQIVCLQSGPCWFLHNPNHLGYSIRGAPRLAVRRKSGQHQSKRRSIDIERDEAKVGLPSTGNDRWWLQKYLNICSSSSPIKTDVYNYILHNMIYIYLHIYNPYIYLYIYIDR